MKGIKVFKNRRGKALGVIIFLVVIIAVLLFLVSKLGCGRGNGGGDGTGSGRSKVGSKTTVVENVKPPVVEPVKPPVVENKDDSKLYLNWNNPDDFNEIEGRINNNLNPKIRTLIIRTQKMKITTAKKEKIEELMKNKGCEAELKFEQLK